MLPVYVSSALWRGVDSDGRAVDIAMGVLWTAMAQTKMSTHKCDIGACYLSPLHTVIVPISRCNRSYSSLFVAVVFPISRDSLLLVDPVCLYSSLCPFPFVTISGY